MYLEDQFISNLFSYKMARIIFLKDWDVRRQNQISKIGTNKQ